MDLTVKTLKQAIAIGKALDRVKPGSGKDYLDGYHTRRMAEMAAIRAVRETNNAD